MAAMKDGGLLVVSLLNRVLYHTQTLWLFTLSDLKTIAVPSTVFGVSNAIVAPVYGISAGTDTLGIILRTPLVFLWVWANLLPFDINNQHTPSAIAEDSINKPWRPLPQGRITPAQAKVAIYCLYPAVQLVSIRLDGGLRQGLALIFLGIWYNNFGGADYHPFVRNSINAMGYICFISGAMEVALGAPIPITTSGSSLRLLQWLLILGSVILTTVHTQDLADQEGDALRGRRTIPLVIGDSPARYTIAIAMLFWGFVCPFMWHGSTLSRALSLLLSSWVIIRTLRFRNTTSDKKTFRIWNLWIAFLYVIPLL
ncbi:UbiA prenyltransferase family [Coniella lustricola]|uniref:UbiA prenyltransferase family n=1 Tax=Coniella lustricola TaxID=2025994 RepID=A0A2T2ZU37_9PEZI|nr:UbiA prenyltransferase family [Coniella lustricola]